jgi:hypothetical protein
MWHAEQRARDGEGESSAGVASGTTIAGQVKSMMTRREIDSNWRLESDQSAGTRGLRSAVRFRLVGIFGLTVSLCAGATSLQAATITAASAKLADVQTAINSANSGDTIQIPAGTASWSGSITLRKSLIISGMGTNSTIIQNAVNPGDYNGAGALIYIALPSDVPLTISNIKFVGVYGSYPINEAIEDTPSGCFPTRIRITQCWFEKFVMAFHIWSMYGVVDHCTFYNNRQALRNSYYVSGGPNPGSYPVTIFPGGTSPPWTNNAGTPNAWGTTNTFCFEDCVFYVDNSIAFNTGPYLFTDTEHPSDFTFRHSTFYIGQTDYNGFDMHGPETESPVAGGAYYANNNVGIKIYKNTVHWTVWADAWTHIRGGNGSLVYSNTFIGSTPTINTYYNMGGDDTSVLALYVWGNYNGNNLIQVNAYALNGQSVPVQGVNYFLKPPSNFNELAYPHPLITGRTPTTNQPSITSQPQSLSIVANSSATFTVNASGSGPLAYKWVLNGVAVSGATASGYTTNNVPLTANGSHYAVIVTNAYGSVTSSVAVLAVTNGVRGSVIPPQNLHVVSQ